MQIDPNKLYDGMLTSEAGMDAGNDPDLIAKNQVAMAVNVTFRGGKPVTRPPWTRLHLEFPQDDADTTQTHKPIYTVEDRANSGYFQGAAFYESIDPNGTGMIIARGGRLFRVQFQGGSNLVTEITIRSQVNVTVAFARPIPNNQVTVTFSSVENFSVGLGLVIDSGTYTVISFDLSSNTAVLSYGGSGANATIVAGTPVMDMNGLPYYLFDTNPDGPATFSHIFQAKQYAIVTFPFPNPEHLIFFDGSTARRSKGSNGSPQELPPAFCGRFSNSRVWLALPNQVSYIAGDIDGGSNTILNATENNLILQGGAFQVPAGAGKIASISTTTVLDAAQGQGPVAIAARRSIWTNQAPTDRTTWQTLTYPIQTEAAVEFGALGPYCTVNVNGDLWYRASDGLRSFIIARRDFNAGWGNTPMSHEVGNILDADNEELLLRCSQVQFDNRLLTTATPKIVADGVVWQSLVVINFDEISGMWNKTNPSWEGAWTGLDLYQIVKCTINGVDRCFGLARGTDGELEIWELLKAGVDDLSYHLIEGKHVIVPTQIQARVDLRSMTFDSPMEPKQLQIAEWFVEEVYDNVTWSISFRPDNYPAYVPWHTVSVCFNTTSCDQVCGGPYGHNPGYVPALETPLAPDGCLVNGVVANLGYEFQTRVMWSGHARLKAIRLQAEKQLKPPRRSPCTSISCTSLDSCDPYAGWLGYKISNPADVL